MVYVDNMRAPFYRYIMCHMYADTLEELNAMADTIGVDRKWFQDRKDFPHYDISISKKKIAIRNGAIQVGWHELIRHVNNNRKLLHITIKVN